MQTLADIIATQQAGRNPVDDPLVERLLAEVVRQAEEVCVLRDRLDTVAALVAKGDVPTDQAVDAFEIADERIAARLERHTDYFAELFARLSDAQDESP